jgi:hypothetical protein
MPRNRVIAKTGEAIVQNITPDVCLTPLGPLVLPLPYAIIARFDLSVEVEGSVSIHGFDAFTMRSRVASVTGNEAGTKGGIISGVNLGFCRPKSSANTIQIGGEFIIQHTDLFWMNCNGPDGPGNCVGKVVYVQVESFVWADANACSFGHADGGDMDYRRFDEALDYMFNEMIKNQDSSTVTAIKDLLSPPKRWYEWLYYKPNTDTVSALALFWGKVHQGGDWDHKGVLDERLGLGSNPGGKDYYFPFRGDINNEYYYDIWSNTPREVSLASAASGEWSACPHQRWFQSSSHG